jgi:hypothetical protein
MAAAAEHSLGEAMRRQYVSKSANEQGAFLLSFTAADMQGGLGNNAEEKSPSYLESEFPPSWEDLDAITAKRLSFIPACTLVGLNLSSLGSFASAASCMRRLKHLDLQGNHLSFFDLLGVLRTAPTLETLDMGNNKLGDVPQSMLPFSSKLRTLAVNSSGVTVCSLSQLLPCLPKLSSLHVCGNGWASLDGLASSAACSAGWVSPITHLFAGDNPLESLEGALSSLSPFQHLSHADFASCSFTTAPCLESAAACPLPLKLHTLGLDECNLSTWAQVQAVGAFPLATLRLRRIPALQPTLHDSNTSQAVASLVGTGTAGCSVPAAAGHGSVTVGDEVVYGTCGLHMARAHACGVKAPEALLRQVCISLLPHVEALNGSSVSADERMSAERFAVRYFRTWAASEAQGIYLSDSICSMRMWAPSALPVLQLKHGGLGPLADVCLDAPESATVEVLYEWEGGGRDGLPRPALVCIKLGQTVRELKVHLRQPLLHINGCGNMRVLYIDTEVLQHFGEQELLFDSILVATLRPAEQDRFRVVVQNVR